MLLIRSQNVLQLNITTTQVRCLCYYFSPHGNGFGLCVLGNHMTKLGRVRIYFMFSHFLSMKIHLLGLKFETKSLTANKNVGLRSFSRYGQVTKRTYFLSLMAHLLLGLLTRLIKATKDNRKCIKV